MSDNELIEVLQSEQSPGALFEIVQYTSLQGSDDLAAAEKVFFANQAGIRLKLIRIQLDQSEVMIEPGALYYMKGSNLELESSSQGSVSRGLMRKFLSGETMFQSRIRGSGEVYLEPSFGHFLLFTIDDDAVIVDKGAFYCASRNLEVTAVLQKNISSALFGGEGLFQTKISGSGVVVLVSPVPVSELSCYELEKGEKLSVDGNFAFVRSESVTFRAEKSAKTLFQSLSGGEGLLQTFEGPGMVWIAPTQVVYERIKLSGGISNMSKVKGSMGSNT